MSIPAPAIDSRKNEDFKRELLARMRDYLPELLEGKDDAGAALAAVVAALFEGTAGRLNQAPAKNYLEFLNTIGVTAPSPTAARVPLTFTLDKDAADPVPVPAGTKASAKNETGETVVFETLRDFSATPAKLERVYYISPSDGLYDLSGVCGGKTPFRFDGASADEIQAHYLYIGHDYLLNLTKDAFVPDITIKLTGCNQSLDSVSFTFSYFDGQGWRDFDMTPSSDKDTNTFINTFTFEKSERLFAKKEVNGDESYWLRLKPMDMLADSVLGGFIFSGIKLAVSGIQTSPECMFYNNVPLPVTDSDYFQPFGARPRTNDAFYIASTDILTKKNCNVTVSYVVGAGLKNDSKRVVLSYEYWNGDGWFALPNTKLTQTSGGETLDFSCPEDCATLKLNGKESYWMRIKIASGDYGREEYILTDKGAGKGANEADRIINTGQPSLQGIEPPNICGLKLIVNNASPVEDVKIVAQNNNNYAAYTQKALSRGTRPFQLSADEYGALYLGFSDNLAKGVLTLFFDTEGEDGDIQTQAALWEYYSIKTESWRKLIADDGTSSLSESGMVVLWLPDNIGQANQFGYKHSWLRRVFTGCNATVCLKGLYVNTVWASQRETVKNEILTLINDADIGVGQRDYYGAVYGFVKNPVLSCDIYVNETQSLTGQEREALLEEGKYPVIEIKNGDATELWVRWMCVPSLLSSGAKDRHYEADFASGRILFGNGVFGAAPPENAGAVKAGYLTGGGSKGNAPASSVKLISIVPSVSGAVNPLPASGGYDALTQEEAALRSASHARRRNRGITAGDFASLAAEYSGIAKVNCIPRCQLYNKRVPGCVTLAVIPENARDAQEFPPGKGRLPPEMRRGLAEYLRARAPAALARSGNIYIVSPVYVAASVTAVIVTEDLYGNPDLAVRAENLLKEYFHPITGGTGDGWQFGATPHIPDVWGLLEGMDGVDYLDRVSMTLSAGENKTFVTSVETIFPEYFCNPFNIICSGRHQVEVRIKTTD